MKIRITLAILLFLFSLQTFSQAPDWLWAKAMGGTGYDDGYSIATDASGNVYATGSFYGTVDFDPGVATFNLTSAGNNDIFISKLNASGNFVWAKRMGGISNDYGSSIAIDPAGSVHVYTTGTFNGTVDFDPGAGTFNLTGGGIFISKLDGSGNFVWAKAISGISHSIALDSAGSGDVYTTGAFAGTTDFDPGAGVFNLTSLGSIDIFISKLDSSGNFIWAKAMGGTAIDEGFSIAFAPTGNGDVYTTGRFLGTADFDPGAGTFNLTSAGYEDIFISKLDSSGNFVWAGAIGSATGNDEGMSIALDPAGSGDVYTTGWFSGTADFDPGAGIFNLTSTPGSDIFISKLDSSGNFVWAVAMGGGNSGYGLSIAIDNSGNVYATGSFLGTVDFDPGAGVFNLTSGFWEDIFISKLDSSSNFVWAKAMGGAYPDVGRSMVIGASGNVHVAGMFQSPSVSFGSTTLTNADNSGNTGDIFIAKLDTLLITGNNAIENFSNGILLFPNPANNHLTISLKNIHKTIEVTISDVTGKIIFTITATETQKIEVSTKDFAVGIYVVQIQAADFIEMKKLIVVK